MNQATHSSVANSRSLSPRHGPACRITTVLYRPMTDSSRALSYGSRRLPTDASMPDVRALLQECDVFRQSAMEAVEEDALAAQVLSAEQRVGSAEEELARATRFARSKEKAWTRIERIVHETRNLASTGAKAGPHERRILFDYWVLDVLVVVEPIPGMKRANYKTAIVTLRTAPDTPLHFDISGALAQRVAAGASKVASAAPSSARTAGSPPATTSAS